MCVVAVVASNSLDLIIINIIIGGISCLSPASAVPPLPTTLTTVATLPPIKSGYLQDLHFLCLLGLLDEILVYSNECCKVGAGVITYYDLGFDNVCGIHLDAVQELADFGPFIDPFIPVVLKTCEGLVPVHVDLGVLVKVPLPRLTIAHC